MTQEKLNKLQESLNILAEVCDKHVATASEHRVIAQALKEVTSTLSSLITESVAKGKDVIKTSDKEVVETVCGAV